MRSLDYALLAGSVIISLIIGVYYAFKKGSNKTTEDYLIGGRKMGLIPIALSLVVSNLSAISILGNTAEIYYYSADILFIPLSYSLGVLLAAHSFVPLLHPLKITSINEVI